MGGFAFIFHDVSLNTSPTLAGLNKHPPSPSPRPALALLMPIPQEPSAVPHTLGRGLSVSSPGRGRGGRAREVPCGGRSTVSKALCSFKSCPCSGGCAGLPCLLLPAADSHLFLCSLKLCSFFTAALCPTLTRSRQGLHFTYSISERHCRLGRALGQSSNFY